MMEKRLYGPGARLALLVSLCLISAPTTQGRTEVVGAIGNGRDFSLDSVSYLGYHGAAGRGGCCRQCTSQFPDTQMFSYSNQVGVCACLKITSGVNPTTTETHGSFAGLCGQGRGRSQRRRRAGRRGRGRRAGSSSPTSSPQMAPDDTQKPEVDPKMCLDLVACVQCQQFESGEYMDGVDDVDQDGVAACDKCEFKPVGVELKAEGWNGFPSLADDPVCSFIDDDMCSFSFIYRYHVDGGLPMVWVQKNKKC